MQTDKFQEIMKKMRLKSQQTLTQNSETSAQYECPKCKDEGGYIVRRKAGEIILNYKGEEVELKHDTDQWVECECSKIKKINRLMKSSEITEEFQKMGFSNFITENRPQVVQNMKAVCMKYYESFNQIRSTRKNSVLLIGQPGSGKTHLLMAVSNNLIQKRVVPVMYFPYKDGMNEISENNFERKSEIMHRMKDIDVLFIDDLFKPIGGKVDVKRWQAEIIFEVVNYRYLNNKPLLVSSELSLSDLLYVDEATASRIFEMAEDYTVTVPKDMHNNYRLRNVVGG
ncbi:ATP-binding protein [Ureibacillus thermosphaericus]|nr:ATP-binding protein [Ureibacillus thermosphaericus]